MAVWREFRAALTLSLRTTLARPRHALLAAAGFLIASATLLGLLTIPAGMAGLAARTGLPDVAVVLTGANPGAAVGGMSSAEQVALIGNLPGVARAADGSALMAPQFVVNVNMRRRDGVRANIVLRGVAPLFWQIMGEAVHLDAGRRFTPGVRELIAGRGAAATFVRLDTGAQTLIRQRPWRVTGQFDTGGSLWDSELWMDISSLQNAWNAPGRVTGVWVKLVSPAAFDAFSEAMARNASLRGLQTVRQTDYYRFQVGFVYRYTRIAAWAIGLLLGLVALLAIANALGMALKARRRDVGVLRALGFRQSALAAALFAEVALTAALCAVVVVALGWLTLDGRGIASATLSQSVQLPLRVSAAVAGWTILYTVVLGLLACIWPIRRVLAEPLARSVAQP